MNEEIPLIVNGKAGRKSALALGLEGLFLRAHASGEEAKVSGEAVPGRIVEAAGRQGLRLRPYVTRHPGHARELADRLIREGAKTILVAGGDGTINEAVQSIARTETSLGILPLGTANTLAIELGIPLDLSGALEVIRRGNRRVMDVGRAGSCLFAMGAGMGFESRVIGNVKPAAKYVFGSLAYILQGIADALFYSFPKLILETPELPAGRREGRLVIVSNARYYGGYFRPAPRARLDDGLLDVLVMKRRGIPDLIRYLAVMKSGDVTRLPDVEAFQCRRFRVTSEAEVRIHVDAEIAGSAPCEFECLPAALRVLAPV